MKQRMSQWSFNGELRTSNNFNLSLLIAWENKKKEEKYTFPTAHGRPVADYLQICALKIVADTKCDIFTSSSVTRFFYAIYC